MPILHLFISKGRFNSEEELDQYIKPEYTDDGDKINSPFMKEVGLSSFEPGCIEATFESEECEIIELLEGSSYEEQWLNSVPENLKANVAVTVYEPNVLTSPNLCTLEYLGGYNYEV